MLQEDLLLDSSTILVNPIAEWSNGLLQGSLGWLFLLETEGS
jgi:hypothetical protein